MVFIDHLKIFFQSRWTQSKCPVYWTLTLDIVNQTSWTFIYAKFILCKPISNQGKFSGFSFILELFDGCTRYFANYSNIKIQEKLLNLEMWFVFFFYQGVSDGTDSFYSLATHLYGPSYLVSPLDGTQCSLHSDSY